MTSTNNTTKVSSIVTAQALIALSGSPVVEQVSSNVTSSSVDDDIPVFEEVDVFMEHVPTQEVAETFEEMIVNNHVFDEVYVPMEQELIQEITENVDVMEVNHPVFDQVEESTPNFDDIVMQNETVQEDEEEDEDEVEVEEDVDVIKKKARRDYTRRPGINDDERKKLRADRQNESNAIACAKKKNSENARKLRAKKNQTRR